MATSMTTGYVINKQPAHNADAKIAALKCERDVKVNCAKTETRYRASAQKSAYTLWLDVDGKEFSFSVFDDVQYVEGQKVTVVKDDNLVTHINTNSTMYLIAQRSLRDTSSRRTNEVILVVLGTSCNKEIVFLRRVSDGFEMHLCCVRCY